MVVTQIASSLDSIPVQLADKSSRLPASPQLPRGCAGEVFGHTQRLPTSSVVSSWCCFPGQVDMCQRVLSVVKQSRQTFYHV